MILLKRLIITYFVVLATIQVSAQKNFVDGYLVTLDSDTLRGQINLKEWTKNPTSFEFRRNPSEDIQAYTTQDVNYFETQNNFKYRRFKLPISMNSIDPLKPELEIKRFEVEQTVFLKIIQQGESITLYSYVDKVKERFFIATAFNQIPQELLFFVVANAQHSEKMVRYYYSYKNELIQLSKNLSVHSTRLEKKINNSEYKASDIISIVNEMNGNTQEAPREQRPAGYLPFVGGGFDFHKMSYKGDFLLAESDATSSLGFSPMINFGIDIFQNRFVRQFAFRSEVFFLQNTMEVKRTFSTPNVMETTIRHQLKRFIAGPRIGLHYGFFNSSGLQVYGGASMALAFTLKEENEYSINRKFRSSSTLQEFSNYPEVKSKNFLYALRVGMILNRKYDFFILRNFNSIMTGYSNFILNQNSFQAGFNYQFQAKGFK